VVYKIRNDVIDWLLEPDMDYPSVRYLTLKNILGEDDKAVDKAAKQAVNSGLIPEILRFQNPDGTWEDPGSIYNPKYRATVWQLILLAQLGADGTHPLVKKTCEFLLSQAMTAFGGFSITGTQSGCANCLQGNTCAALLDLGFGDDNRLKRAVEWMARSVTGEGFTNDRKSSPGSFYLRSGISGPGFLCSATDHKPCAWGAVKVGLALGKVSRVNQDPSVKKAIKICIDFLLSTDPAGANYPHPYAKKPSQSWFRFGFPVFYVTDVLQILEALIGLGLAGDNRLENAIALVEEKADENGRWKMAYTYNGKMWADIENKGEASKWVTYRTLKVLTAKNR
jgi:hypothetical protein